MSSNVPAGRDLTAQDVEDAIHPPGPEDYRHYAADYLNRIARPAAGPRADDEPDVMKPLRREMRDGMADYDARAAAGPRAGDTAPTSGAHVIQTRGFPDDFVPPSASLDRPAGDTAPDDEVPAEWEKYLRRLAASWSDFGGGKRLAEALGELDRLRSEVAALRDAGNALAEQVLDTRVPPDRQEAHRLSRGIDAWRSAAGAAPAGDTAAPDGPLWEFVRWLDALDAPDSVEVRRRTCLDDVIRRGRRAAVEAAGSVAPDQDGDTAAWPGGGINSAVEPATLCGKHVRPGRRCALRLRDDLVCPDHGQRTLPGPDQDGDTR